MDKLKIGAVEHDNRSKLWCGPAVISSVIGVGTKAIAEELRAFRKRQLGDRRHRIAGVTNRELVDVLLEHGVVPRGVLRLRDRPATADVVKVAPDQSGAGAA